MTKMENESWEDKMETLKEKVKQCEIKSRQVNGLAGAPLATKVNMLIMLQLTLAYYMARLPQLQGKTALSSSDTQRMEVLLSFGLWVMVNRIMTLLGHQRMWTSILEHLPLIILPKSDWEEAIKLWDLCVYEVDELNHP
jgi:hypothetical protein